MVQGAVEETKTPHLCVLRRINYFAVFSLSDYKVNRRHRIKCWCNADDLQLYLQHSYKQGTACEEELMEQLAKAEVEQEKDDVGRGQKAF